VSEFENQFGLELQEFESKWESGVVAEFASSIPIEARSNTDLLTDLACIDLQNRIQRDRETRVESYVTAFPQLANDDLVLLELIRTEYLFRPDRDLIDAQSYCQRFPHLSRQIEMMFQLEFKGSGPVLDRQASPGWRCSYCNADVAGRDDGETTCKQCGHSIAIGRYELIERIGEGAFGFVYRARDPKLNREVAVKLPRSNRFLTPEESERFLRESRNAAQLDHPGIVRIFDTGRHNGIPYIVSEFIAGQPLSNWLADRELDFRESAEVMVEISDAVAHAHQRGVIHRDLKPSNIMISTDESHLQPRVMDFGLARHSQSDITVTIDGQTVGTPAFMSPEQARGDLAAVGPQSDVYSLGIILFQLLCGEVPFRGNVQMLIQQVIHDDPPSPARFRNRIPRDLETICMKAINREPDGRYGGVKEFGDDLSRWLDGKPIHARPIGTFGKLWRWSRRRPAVATLLFALTIAILAGLAGVTWQWREAEAARIASEADLSDALESVDRVLGHLGSNTLADIPQAKQLRAEVLNDALVFFQRFRQRNPDDPRVAMQVANAHYQVARIQQALGKNTEAARAYQAATEGYEKIQDRAPDREHWLESAAMAHSGFASFLLRQSKREQAQVQQKKCLALRKLLLEEHPKSGKYVAKYATAQADLARTLVKSEAIEAEYEAAVKQLESLVKERDAIGYQRDLARVLNNYAIHLAKVGKNGKAEKYREQAIGLLEKVIADDPNDESKLSIYANCCLQLVKTLREESRTDAAVEYQKKAVAAYQRLTEDYPATPRHRERFASVLREVGSLASVQNRTDDEIEAHESAVRQRETLVALFPNNRGYQWSLVEDLGALSESLVEAGQKSEAEDRLREKLELLRELSDEESLLDRIRLVRGIRDLEKLISTSSSRKKIAESKSLRAESERLISDLNVQQVMASELSNGKKISLLGSLISLAKKEGDLDTIESSYRAKIKLFEEGVKLDPDKLSRRSGLANNWANLGRALRSTDRQEDTVEAYQNAIRIDEELLKADPESATYASQLIGHSSSLGQLLMVGGKPAEAANVIRRSLELAKKLSSERNGETFRQVRVVLAYTQLGDALAMESKDFAGALAAYEEAVAMSEVLRQQPDMEKYEGLVLNAAAWFLVTCPDESLRDPKRALELARQATSINPENANQVSTLAFAFYENGDYDAAIENFEKSTQLSADLAPLNVLMTALAQAKSGKIETARRSLAEAIRLNKSNATEPELFEIYRQEAEQIIQRDK
jgi:tetratricopeptide (TPR) repeat protein/tRNA A-37 threonylcarbamoyl transferase component Bud32